MAHPVQHDDDGFRVSGDRPRQIPPFAAAEVLNGPSTPRLSLSEDTDGVSSDDEDIGPALSGLWIACRNFAGSFVVASGYGIQGRNSFVFSSLTG
jgi:hypothetical protein